MSEGRKSLFASCRAIFAPRWWNRPGVPWIYLSGHVLDYRVRLKFPPDAWWRWRWCSRGDCAYGNFMCPNGCKEDLILDD